MNATRPSPPGWYGQPRPGSSSGASPETTKHQVALGELSGQPLRRGLDVYALEALDKAAATGDISAAVRLAELLSKRGELDSLRGRANAGDMAAADRLADLLAERGELEELRTRANAGDQWAAERLAWMLAGRGALDELRSRADGGDSSAADRLADLLAERGELDELRNRADSGDTSAGVRLADLLAERGELDELRSRADAGDQWSADRFARMLAGRDELDELRSRADHGDISAASRLAWILSERGKLDRLRTAVDDGDTSGALLARLLAERGELDELRGRADAGDQWAGDRLARLLAERGELDELRGRADTGDQWAADKLARLLAERGELDELRGRADAGDQWATQWLAQLLADRRQLDELSGRADAGDPWAAQRLAHVLAEENELNELSRRAEGGDPWAAKWIAWKLAEQSDIDGLRDEVAAGTFGAIGGLTALLKGRGTPGNAAAVSNHSTLRRFKLGRQRSVLALMACLGVALVNYGVYASAATTTDVSSITTQDSLVDSTLSGDGVVAALQAERLLTYVDLLGQGSLFGLMPDGGLPEVRRRTDRAFRSLVLAFRGNVEEATLVDTSQTAINRTRGLRAQIDAYEGPRDLSFIEPAHELFEQYSELLKPLKEALLDNDLIGVEDDNLATATSQSRLVLSQQDNLAHVADILMNAGATDNQKNDDPDDIATLRELREQITLDARALRPNMEPYSAISTSRIPARVHEGIVSQIDDAASTGTVDIPLTISVIVEAYNPYLDYQTAIDSATQSRIAALGEQGSSRLQHRTRLAFGIEAVLLLVLALAWYIPYKYRGTRRRRASRDIPQTN